MPHVMRRRALLALLAAGALVAASCSSGQERSQPTEPAEPAAVQPEQVELGFDGTAFTFVEELEAEPVTISFTNGHDEPAMGFIARVNEGSTIEDVFEAFETEGEEAGFALITPAGNTPETGPGETTSVTIQFPEGSYAVFGEGDEEPAVFEVGPASGPEVEQPEHDAVVEMGEYYFDVSGEVPAGEATLLLTNVGEQGHEFTGGPGRLEAVFGDEEESEDSFFAIAPAPGGKVWLTHEFRPGPYGFACFFPDPESGKPHRQLGMEGELTVG